MSHIPDAALKTLNRVAVVVAALAAVFAASYASAQAPERFTIRQALSAPFPTELVASPSGDAVAWIFDSEGASNLWVASAPTWKGRAITRFPRETGLELSSPRWLPDGSGLVFVRGQGGNRRGESPNPAFDPKGTRQAVVITSLSGDTRELGDGHEPAVSPDGRTIAFVRSGGIWTIPAAAGGAATRLFVGRGTPSEMKWSPDGSSIAFSSDRGDHSFVGVFNVVHSKLTYLDASVDNDLAPTWSPDASRVAFIRIPAATRQIRHAVERSATPWSIRIADAHTGLGREIWRAHAGSGSVYHAIESSGDQLFWAASDEIVFPWEGTGWCRLYAVSAAGGAARALMQGSGPFELQQAHMTRDRKSMLAVSNENDADRWHIWTVPIDGSERTLLTTGDGLQWLGVPLADGSVAMLRSSATEPARPARVAQGRMTDLAPDAIPSDYPSTSMVKPQQVTFRAADGLVIHGQLFVPADGPSRHPAIIFYHGGSRRQMLLGFHPMGYYHNAYALNQYFASRGYVVLSVNYRSGTGYGLDFREATNYGPLGATESRDAVAATHFLAARAEVDSSRMGVWGGSYGGYMTALSLARIPASFKAGVDFAGVHDWNLEWDKWIDSWDMTHEMEIRRLAYASSPLSDLSRWKAPVLLIQGDDDRNVNFANTVELTEDLRKHDVHVETIVYPDETHDWLLHEHWVQSYEATAAFLMRYTH